MILHLILLGFGDKKEKRALPGVSLYQRKHAKTSFPSGFSTNLYRQGTGYISPGYILLISTNNSITHLHMEN